MTWSCMWSTPEEHGDLIDSRKCGRLPGVPTTSDLIIGIVRADLGEVSPQARL
jgi:hypothetical protein